MEDSEDIQNKIEKQQEIYKRVKLLGSGSFGKAYLVRQIKDDTLWVIKQINMTDMLPQEQQNAMKQAKVLELLNHQNIIKFRQVYRTPKMKLNIVMEFAEGGDLSQRIKKSKETMSHFEQDDILSWFTQICLGVKHIHDRKIIHRDLKAQNIFLTEDNLVKIGDFGVARILENTMSKARTVVGSPYYLSPEIIQNKPYSYKTDIWSLGTLLFQMCALVPPFTANNLQFLALKIVRGAYNQIPNKYSNELKNLIKTMLHTKENSRPNINQILCSKIIASRIGKFLTQSQAPKSNKQNLKNTFHDFSLLKAPPNLLLIDDMTMNKSDIILKQQLIETSPAKEKSKTPLVNMTKKGPNNFFNRPMSSKRKIQEISDLADLMKIKPSHLQIHEKIQKQLLPKVPKPVFKDNEIKAQNMGKKDEILIKSPPMSAFTKKRPSFNRPDPMKSQLSNAILHTGMQPKVFKPKEGKQMKAKVQEKKFNPSTKAVGKIQNQDKKPLKPQIRKRTTVAIKPRKIGSPQTNLEVCSQQAKKKIVVQKKVQRQKKNDKKRKETKPKKKIGPKEPAERQIMQEQKCNSQHDLVSNYSSNYEYYQNQQFESYDSYSSSEVDLSLSDSTNPASNNQNYQKMLKEMENIQKIVSEANGNVSSLPMFGESIPQLIAFSSDIRQDDSEMESNQCSAQSEQNKNQELAHLGFISNHEQIQKLRINLQELFGEDAIIFAYRAVQEKIERQGLDLQEQEIIQEIFSKRPDINESKFRQYFRLIVTAISLENNII